VPIASSALGLEASWRPRACNTGFGVEWGSAPDAPAGATTQDDGMVPRRVQIHVDVTVDGPTIAGAVTTVDFDRPFSGHLGLIAAIEEALTTADEPESPMTCEESGR